MTAPRKGWCPGALRPMASGDGLIVRVRPRGGRLALAQAAALAGAAADFGNGEIDLTRRASVQLRGVTPASHGPLLARLAAHELLDEDAAGEAIRNVVCDPRGGLAPCLPETAALARALEAALAAEPALRALPGKFGFVIDPAPAPILHHVPADIRLEGAGGRLLLVPDGATAGVPVAAGAAIAGALALARWFAAGVGGARRMREAVAALGADAVLARIGPGALPRAAPAAPLDPGLAPGGAVVGAPFGRLDAAMLTALARHAQAAGARELRVTPWRAVLIPGLDADALAALAGLDLIVRADDPRRFVAACPGQPACAAASVETRALAAALAPKLAGATLHVSGCAKGCAEGGAADVTLVGRDGVFDIVRRGAVADAPARRAVAPADVARVLAELP